MEDFLTSICHKVVLSPHPILKNTQTNNKPKNHRYKGVKDLSKVILESREGVIPKGRCSGLNLSPPVLVKHLFRDWD